MYTKEHLNPLGSMSLQKRADHLHQENLKIKDGGTANGSSQTKLSNFGAIGVPVQSSWEADDCPFSRKMRVPSFLE